MDQGYKGEQILAGRWKYTSGRNSFGLNKQYHLQRTYPILQSTPFAMLQPMSILLLVLLALLVIAALYALLERYLRYRENALRFEERMERNKALAPLKISGCERLIIMLERITPTSLVMRQRVSGTTSAMLQLELMKAIREEFEHNVSLQMYVSPECWSLVRKAKDETTELVRIAFTKVSPESPGIDLSNQIFKLEAATGNTVIRQAIAAIREDLARYF
ncbi:MAG: hypothetical protein ACK5XV_07970 [Flavobacteriales bacterium]